MKCGLSSLLAIGLLLPNAAYAQRDGAVVAPAPGDVEPVDPVPIPPEPEPIHSPFAGGYRLSINDTRGPQECLTYAVGWMLVLPNSSFVMWARNPQAGGSALVHGEVKRNGKLVFSPPLPDNVRAALRIHRRGRCVSALSGRYLVITPPIVPGDPTDPVDPTDTGDGAIDEARPVLGVVRDHRKKKAGIVVGYRR